jgi:long-chain acyl-CoA synthetase
LHDSQTDYPKIEADTLSKYLKLNAERYGNLVFMRRKQMGIWQRFTWESVYEQVRSFALGLMKLGLKRGETVAIVGDNEPELFWAVLAALAAGGKVVCLYPDMTPQEILYILEHSESVFLVRGMWKYDDPILMEFKAVQEMGRLYHDEDPDLFENNVAAGRGDDIAILSYTSGTTGLPKAVVVSQNYLLDNAFRLLMVNDFKPFVHYLSYLPPAWGAELFFFAMGVINPFIYNFAEEPETVQANIRELGPGILVFGPRQWENLASIVQARMLDAGPVRRLLFNAGMKVGMKMAAQRTEGIRAGILWRVLYPLADLFVLMPIRDNLGLRKTIYTLTGGAPTAPDIFRFFHAMGVKLRNGYGSTEMGMYTQHLGEHFDPESLGQWYRSHPDFGPPLEWRLDEDGGLLIRGGSGFSGYYKNPEATAKSTKDGWFISGDAIKMKENGELVFLDRVSDLKKLATGDPFPPQFIEIRLRFSPYVKDAMVLGDESKAFVAALVNIDAETVGRWAERQGIAYTTFPDLSQKPEVCDLIQKELEWVNQVLDAPSKVKRFVNLPKEFDPDEAELTRTRKLRRDFLEDRYGELIKAIYGGEDDFVAEVPVKYRDGRTGVVKNISRINTIGAEGSG